MPYNFVIIPRWAVCPFVQGDFSKVSGPIVFKLGTVMKNERGLDARQTNFGSVSKHVHYRCFYMILPSFNHIVQQSLDLILFVFGIVNRKCKYDRTLAQVKYILTLCQNIVVMDIFHPILIFFIIIQRSLDRFYLVGITGLV